ncbi:V-type ATP synthase subunit I [Christensenellaceae bacterium OttesenSCG-928-M15]|nr:V-type ATP synthase subunit I [Christensenellaceae bacterium OttesenSCG-928-M15]
MKRLSLVALKEDEERIMRALQAISAVQIIKTGDAAEDDDALMRAEGAVQRFNGALSLLKPYAKKPSFLEPKPEYSLNDLQENIDEAQQTSEKIEKADRRKAAIRASVDKLYAQIEALSPWKELSVQLVDVAATRSTALFAGKIKAEQVEKLTELDPLCAAETYGGEKEKAVLILCPKDLEAQVSEFLKDVDWSDYVFPKLKMTALEAIKQDEQQIAALQKEAQGLEAELVELGKNRAVIANAADAAVINRDRALANTLVEKTEAAFALEGWVREDDIQKVEDAVKKESEAYYIETRDPNEDEVQPSVVQNGKFARPYESVTNLYSRPMPGSIDGTPFMAPWYFLLFGMMLSDTGYGILLTLGCLFFIKKAKPRGMMGDLAHVIMWGGVSTIVWGFLTGTFFGFDWNVLFNTDGVFPLLVDPNKDPIGMLLLCFGLGLIHIFCGVFIKIYMCFRDGDWQSALFDNISWVMIIFGLLIFAGGNMLFDMPALSSAGIVLALVGAAMVLFMKGRGKKNIAKRLVSGAGGLYDVTSYLSDVLSYARLFALGIATGVIGSVFNQLVGMLMNASDMIVVKIIMVVVGVALFVGLHLFNIGINTLGTFVHCARLQYVEFYGKFYEVGGREFMPLTYRTRHTRVL